MTLESSPLYASEFGDEYVARLAGFNGSIPNVYRDQPTSMNLVSCFIESPHIMYLQLLELSFSQSLSIYS